jgi:hypothetical protein
MGSKWGGMETMRSVYEQPVTRVDRSYRSKGAKGNQQWGDKKQGEAPICIPRLNVYIKIVPNF